MTVQSVRPARTAETVLVLSVLAGVALRVALSFFPGYITDQTSWADYARYIAAHGLSHVYALTLSKPFLGIYPPLHQALLGFVGEVYQQFFSAEFVFPSRSILFLLKLVPIFGDCAIGLVMYWFVRRAGDFQSAVFASTMFLLNPAILFDFAYWGMFGDSFYTLFLVLSLIALYYGRTNLQVAALVVALAIKPQAMAFVPLAVFSLIQYTSLSKWLQALATAAGVIGLIWFPFILNGTVAESVAALRRTVGLMPVLSANAHNVWYLLSPGNSWTSDVAPVLGPITARIIGVVAFGAACLLSMLGLRRPAQNKRLFPIAAYTGLAFFMLLTEMHENYLYPTVTLLVLASWQSRPLRVLAASLTLTWLANMALHDPGLITAGWLPLSSLGGPRLLNSAINVALFGGWTVWLAWDAFFAGGWSRGGTVQGREAEPP